MADDTLIDEKDEIPAFSIIQRIKDGSLDPRALDKETRLQCVTVFISEGCTIFSIAQILKRNERTVRRDIEEIRESNAISPDPLLAKKIIGEFLANAHIHRDYLMRLARSKDASVSEKNQAEYHAAQVESNAIAKLQSLGYLPSETMDSRNLQLPPPPLQVFVVPVDPKPENRPEDSQTK